MTQSEAHQTFHPGNAKPSVTCDQVLGGTRNLVLARLVQAPDAPISLGRVGVWSTDRRLSTEPRPFSRPAAGGGTLATCCF